MVVKGSKPEIGITLGDINGIGPEVIIKVLSDNRVLNLLTPVVYGSTKTLSYYKNLLKQDDFNYTQVKKGELIKKRVNVVNCWDEVVEIKTGQSTPESGRCSLLALEKAVTHLKEGKIKGLVTGPINKKSIQSDDFKFEGHTEYLTQKFALNETLMFMVTERLKVGMVTGHMPLKDVANKITKERVEKKLEIMEQSLSQDFGINKPRIAVLGLNPHAGEAGLLGQEEEKIIIPVIDSFKEKGALVFGPFSADGLFGSGEFAKYDGILAMYHDQGLIPFKTLAFKNGVNFTAGLPAIRTSPDHGTAYSIAGTNSADPSSFRDALFLTLDIYKNRQESGVKQPT